MPLFDQQPQNGTKTIKKIWKLLLCQNVSLKIQFCMNLEQCSRNKTKHQPWIHHFTVKFNFFDWNITEFLLCTIKISQNVDCTQWKICAEIWDLSVLKVKCVVLLITSLKSAQVMRVCCLRGAQSMTNYKNRSNIEANARRKIHFTQRSMHALQFYGNGSAVCVACFLYFAHFFFVLSVLILPLVCYLIVW